MGEDKVTLLCNRVELISFQVISRTHQTKDDSNLYCKHRKASDPGSGARRWPSRVLHLPILPLASQVTLVSSYPHMYSICNTDSQHMIKGGYVMHSLFESVCLFEPLRKYLQVLIKKYEMGIIIIIIITTPTIKSKLQIILERLRVASCRQSMNININRKSQRKEKKMAMKKFTTIRL